MNTSAIWIAGVATAIAVTYAMTRLFGRRLARRSRGLAMFACGAVVPIFPLFGLVRAYIWSFSDPHDASAYAMIGFGTLTLILLPVCMIASAVFIDASRSDFIS